MSEVKRYDEGYIPSPVCSEYGIIEDTKGDYVLYSDYKAKEAECKKLEEKEIMLVILNQKLEDKIEKLTAINKTLLDACEVINNTAKSDSPLMDNSHFVRYKVHSQDAINFEDAIQEAKTGCVL